MTLQTSGPISLGDIRDEFNSTATGLISLQNYYRGGRHVPATRGAQRFGVFGQPEIQRVPYSGTRSNVVTSLQDEIISLSFLSGFNSGLPSGQYPSTGGFAITNLGSVTHSEDDSYSWPTGSGTLHGVSGITYTAGGGASSSRSAVEATITNNTGATIDLSNARLRVLINTTSVPSGGATSPHVFIRDANGDIAFSASTSVSGTGNDEGIDRQISVSADAQWANGESLTIYILESFSTQLPFTYSVSSVEMSFSQDPFIASTGPTSYSFNIDNDATVFTGGGFSALGTRTAVIRATGNFSDNRWDLRDGGTSADSSVSFSSWNAWVGNWLRINPSGSGNAFTEGVVRITVTLGTGNTATFNVTSTNGGTETHAYEVGSIVSQTGTPNTSGNISVVFLGESNELTGTFSANANATTALNNIRTAILNAGYPGVTVSTPASASEATSFSGTIPTRDGSAVGSNEWDLRSNTSHQGASANTRVEYSTWNDFVGNYLHLSTTSSNEETIYRYDDYGNRTVELTIGSATATFNVTDVTAAGTFGSNSHPILVLGSIVSQTGTPPTSGSLDYELSADIQTVGVEIDTNQSTNISQTVVMTANGGNATRAILTAQDGQGGSGVLSTYTVTDYSGNQVTAFTSSVTDSSMSDEATVVTNIVNAINNNVETPIDFMAVGDQTNNRVTLTAQSNSPLDLSDQGLDIQVTINPSSTGSLNFQIMGMEDLSVPGILRDYISGPVSYTSLDDAASQIVSLLDADPDLSAVHVISSSGIVLNIQSSTMRLSSSSVQWDGTTNISVVDNTGGGEVVDNNTPTPDVTSGYESRSTELWSVTAVHGSGNGNFSIGTITQTQAGAFDQPARDTRENINESIPTSGVITLTDFYGTANDPADAPHDQ